MTVKGLRTALLNYHDDTELLIFAGDAYYQKCKITTALINEDDAGIYEVYPGEEPDPTEVVMICC